MGRREIVAGFLVLVLGVIILGAIGVGSRGEEAGTQGSSSSSATGGRPYGKICLTNMECDLGQGTLTVKEVDYTDPPGAERNNIGSVVAVEFTYEYMGSSGSVDVRRLPFVLEDGGGDLYEYHPSLTREYAMSRGLVLAYGDGDDGYGTVHYELSMPGAAVFAVPPGQGKDFTLYAADVVDPGSGSVARIELILDQGQDPTLDRQ